MRPQLFAAVLVLWTLSCAASPSFSDRAPQFFVQSGIAERDTQSYTVGASFAWDWQKDFPLARATGYTEFAVGRWASPDDAGGGDRWVTQIGITPVIRLQPDGAYRNWFAEVGIGANAALSLTLATTLASDESSAPAGRKLRSACSISRMPGSSRRIPERIFCSFATRVASKEIRSARLPLRSHVRRSLRTELIHPTIRIDSSSGSP
jgi:hypothetical protein